MNIFCNLTYNKVSGGHQPVDLVHLPLVLPVKVVQRAACDHAQDDHSANDDCCWVGGKHYVADAFEGAERKEFVMFLLEPVFASANKKYIVQNQT